MKARTKARWRVCLRDHRRALLAGVEDSAWGIIVQPCLLEGKSLALVTQYKGRRFSEWRPFVPFSWIHVFYVLMQPDLQQRIRSDLKAFATSLSTCSQPCPSNQGKKLILNTWHCESFRLNNWRKTFFLSRASSCPAVWMNRESWFRKISLTHSFKSETDPSAQTFY